MASDSEIKHVSVRVSTFRGDQKIDFDAYIKIDNRFILYLRKGDSFEGARLARLRSKKLKKMFILPEQEENYRQYLSRNIQLAYNKGSPQTIETRAEVVQGLQQSNAERVMEEPQDIEAYNDAKVDAGRFVEFLNQEDKALAHILNIENLDGSVAHHGVTVSTLAHALAKKIGIGDSKQKSLLALGALLHDFDHFHSGVNVARPLTDFSPVEMKAYKEHPRNGASRVQNLRHFDQQVINIIAQHEEYIDGRGWPAGLKESELDPLAVLVASCNALDRIISFEGKPKQEAAKILLLSSLGRYPLQHLQFLSDLINGVGKSQS